MELDERFLCELPPCLGYSHVLDLLQEERRTEGPLEAGSGTDSDPDSSMWASEQTVITQPETDICLQECSSSPRMDTGSVNEEIRCAEPMTPDSSPGHVSFEMDCSPAEHASKMESSVSAVPGIWEEYETSPMDNCNYPEYQTETESCPQSTTTDNWDEYDEYEIFRMNEYSHYQTEMECCPPPTTPGPDYRPFPTCENDSDLEYHAQTQCMESWTSNSTHEMDGHPEYTRAPQTDNRLTCTPENDSCSENVLSDRDSCLESTSDMNSPDSTPRTDGFDEKALTPEACQEYIPEPENRACPVYIPTPKSQLFPSQPAPEMISWFQHIPISSIDSSSHHPNTKVHSPGRTTPTLRRRPRHQKSKDPKICRYNHLKTPQRRRREEDEVNSQHSLQHYGGDDSGPVPQCWWEEVNSQHSLQHYEGDDSAPVPLCWGEEENSQHSLQHYGGDNSGPVPQCRGEEENSQHSLQHYWGDHSAPVPQCWGEETQVPHKVASLQELAHRSLIGVFGPTWLYDCDLEFLRQD